MVMQNMPMQALQYPAQIQQGQQVGQQIQVAQMGMQGIQGVMTAEGQY